MEKIAIHYNNLGLAYDKIDEYDRAISSFTKAIEIVNNIFGGSHPYIAASYNNLGLVYHSKGEFDQAIFYYKNALELFMRVSDHTNLDIRMVRKNMGRSWNRFGMLFYQKKQYQEAIQQFHFAYQLNKEIRDSSFLIPCSINLAFSFMNLGKVDSGLIYLNEGIVIAMKLNKDHDDLLLHKVEFLCQLRRKKEGKAILKQLRMKAQKEKDKNFLKKIKRKKCK